MPVCSRLVVASMHPGRAHRSFRDNFPYFHAYSAPASLERRERLPPISPFEQPSASQPSHLTAYSRRAPSLEHRLLRNVKSSLNQGSPRPKPTPDHAGPRRTYLQRADADPKCRGKPGRPLSAFSFSSSKLSRLSQGPCDTRFQTSPHSFSKNRITNVDPTPPAIVPAAGTPWAGTMASSWLKRHIRPGVYWCSRNMSWALSSRHQKACLVRVSALSTPCPGTPR